MKWSLRKVLGLNRKESELALIRASRLEEKLKPDGKKGYVPLTSSGRVFQAIKDGLLHWPRK